MAFPSGKNKLTLQKAFDLSRSLSRTVKQAAVDIRAKSLINILTRKQVMEFPTTLTDAIDDWNAARALPGIGQYARDQIDDQAIVLGTEFNAMITTATGTRDWIVTNFPSNSGFLLERSFDVNGRMVIGILTTAQTAGLRVQLDLLIAAIDD